MPSITSRHTYPHHTTSDCSTKDVRGSSDGARCCRCAVLWCFVFLVSGAQGLGLGLEKMEETRHPSHRRYRWWSGMMTGAVAGASPTGPWTDGRTGIRTPDHDERQPWRIPLDRPCLLPVRVKNCIRKNWTVSVVPPPTHCKSPGTGANAPLWVLDRLDVQGPSSPPVIIPDYLICVPPWAPPACP